MKFRKHFDYDVEKASNEAAISFEGEESLTQQSMAEEADINFIVERFGITGKMPENPRVPMYGDFEEVFDYQTAMNAVAKAQDMFMQLPAKIRSRFSNDPQELLAFVADDANIEEARKLGLLKEKVDVAKQSGSERSASGGESGGPPTEAGGAEPGDSSSKPAGAVGSSKPAGV